MILIFDNFQKCLTQYLKEEDFHTVTKMLFKNLLGFHHLTLAGGDKLLFLHVTGIVALHLGMDLFWFLCIEFFDWGMNLTFVNRLVVGRWIQKFCKYRNSTRTKISNSK